MASPTIGGSTFAALFGGGKVADADTASATSQIAGLTTNFNLMKGGLTTSLSVADTLAPDLKDAVDLSQITTAMDNTTKLQEVCKNMTTEQCAIEQARLQAETDAAQLKFYKDTLAESITQLTAIGTDVQNRLSQIKIEKGQTAVFKGESIIPQFEALITSINGDIALLQASVPYINPTVDPSVPASGSSGSGSSRPEYTLPVTGTKSGYQEQLDALNISYGSLMGRPIDTDQVQTLVYKWFVKVFVPMAFYMSIALGAVVGGIVCSNLFAEEKSLYNRIYYFVYGMLGFPFALAYCMLFPPLWVSTIIPIYGRLSAADITDTPKLVQVIKGKISPTVDGGPLKAPAGMMWRKAASASEFFTYLIPLDGKPRPVGNLPAPPNGLKWFSTLANNKQEMWALQEAPKAF